MPTTEEGIPGVMARNGGIAMKTGGALSAAAQRVQAAGKGEDKILVHINPDEYAELVRKHGPAVRNEDTGLPQLGFFKFVGRALRAIAPAAVGLVTGNPFLGAALGAGIGAATSGGRLSGILSGAAMGGMGAGVNAAGGLGKVFEGGISSGLTNLGKIATQGMLGTAGEKGLPGLLSSATSPLGLGALGLMASSSKQKEGDSGATPPSWFNPPWANKGAGTAAGPNLVAPTLETMMPSQRTRTSPVSFVQTANGQVVPVSADQAKVLSDYAAMQNAYGQNQPVYANTGGLARVRRYADGGQAEQVRVGLTPDEIKAQGIDFYTFGEKPLPANFSFFKYTNAPKPAPTTPAPTLIAPTPVVSTTPAKTDPNPVYDDQGRVIAANVDVSRYWDPQTGQYLGNWRGIDNYLREMGTTPTQTATDAPTYRTLPAQIDSDYWSSFKKGGALSRYVKGEGDGQEDKIPAMLSDGEYVMDAETVSAIGNGSSEAGAKKLDEFRMNLRKHKRSAPIGKIPPKTKHLSKYMSGGSR